MKSNDSESRSARVIVISSVRWDFLWQRHQALAAALADLGCDVTFIEPHPRGLRHLWQFGWNRIAGRGGRPNSNSRHGVEVLTSRTTWFRRRPAAAIQRADDGVDLCIAYLPSRSVLRLVEDLVPAGFVYDAVLDWETVPRQWFPPRNWRAVEKEFVRLANSLTAGAIASDSPVLLADGRFSGAENRVWLPPAADTEFSSRAWAAPGSAAPPVLGFFGTARPSEIDIDYLSALAKRFDVRFIGNADANAVVRMEGAGIQIKAAMPLPDLVHEMDVWTDIILPYKESGRSDTLVPAKIWNCLASRRRVHVRNLSLPEDIHRHLNRLPADAASFEPVGTCFLNDSPTWEQRVVTLLREIQRDDLVR